MALHITSIVAGLLALAMLPLAVSVTLRRIKLGNVVFGHADDEILLRRIRAHGNFIEYVPIALIVLGLAEFNTAPSWLILLAGVLLVVGRMIHMLGALFVPYAAPPRGVGMLMTYAACGLPACYLLWATASG